MADPKGQMKKLTTDPANATTCIYGLVDPKTQIVRYVGKSNDVHRRFRRHLHDARDGKTDHKSRWIASLIREGRKPGIVILEVCRITDWKARERFWIGHYRQISDLCNAKDGGDGFDPTAEVRAKMSAAKKGKPAHNRGRSPSDETRRKQSEAAKRRWERMTPEERDAYHAGNRGRVSGQALKTGWNHTPESRAKIAAAGRLRGALSPEQVVEIRRELASGGYGTGRALAAQYGVTERVISTIKHGHAYRDEAPI